MRVIKVFERVVNERITLKQLTKSDANQLLDLVNENRHHLGEWLPWVEKSKSIEDFHSFIERTSLQSENKDGVAAGIWYKDELVGVIGYHGINHSSESTSIGYWIAKDFQSRGIITKSCRSLVEHAFEDLALHRVEIRCAIENYQSREIPERLGFRKEGVIRDAELVNGEFVSHVIYGLLRYE